VAHRARAHQRVIKGSSGHSWLTELGLAPLHFRMQEALEERAKEVRVTNLMRWTIRGH
jgi:hypothetical protein